MKKSFARMAAALLAAIFFIIPVEVGAISAEKAIVMDADTGRVLFEKNAGSRSLIASTTKIMTALLVCEQCNVLDRVCIPKEAVGIEGSSMYLQEGEILTVQDLLYGLMLRSGNDAAVALAIYCGGTVEGFVAMMNDKARQLGLNTTNFQNPHGLDGTHHYSCAEDLAILTSYAMKNPIFAKTVSTKTVQAGNRLLTNHNKLLWRMDGVEGVKTGYTKAAGRILVSSATRSGRRLIAVTINAPDDWNDHIALFNAGFLNYKPNVLIEAGELLGYADVSGGIDRQVSLVAKVRFEYALAPSEDVCLELQTIDSINAPISCDQYAGEVVIYVDGQKVGQVPVCFGEMIWSLPEKIPFWKKLFGCAIE